MKTPNWLDDYVLNSNQPIRDELLLSNTNTLENMLTRIPFSRTSSMSVSIGFDNSCVFPVE